MSKNNSAPCWPRTLWIRGDFPGFTRVSVFFHLGFFFPVFSPHLHTFVPSPRLSDAFMLLLCFSVPLRALSPSCTCPLTLPLKECVIHFPSALERV